MPEHVVIAGGGFGGLYAARPLLKVMPPQRVKVTLVNNRNCLLYAPLLPAVAGGTVEPRHVVVPLREGLKEGSQRLGEITGADPAKRELYLTAQHGGEQTITYDCLIVALGSVARTFRSDGLTTCSI